MRLAVAAAVCWLAWLGAAVLRCCGGVPLSVLLWCCGAVVLWWCLPCCGAVAVVLCCDAAVPINAK